MKILIEAHHPADIHFWRSPIALLAERGHDVLMLSRDRDVMRELHGAYPEIEYSIISRTGKSNRFPVAEFLQRQVEVVRAILRFKPDLVASCMGSYTQSAWIFGKPNVIFTDSEFQHFNHSIAHPFATSIHTPECFEKPLGRKQKKYRGFHELTSLSADHFRGDSERVASLDPDGRGYAIVRLSAWNTLHDIGMEGVSGNLPHLLRRIESVCNVWISAEEGRLSEEFDKYLLRIPAVDYHQALAFAKIIVTEGATTASEAAVLGTPVLYVNPSTRGYLDYLESKYSLVRQSRSAAETLEELESMLQSESLADDCRCNSRRLARDHVDVSRYVADVLEAEAEGT